MIRINCGPGHLVFWDELGVYKLLGNLCQTKEAEVFLNEYIGSLIEYDKRKNGGLVKTLEALIRNNWEMKVTAGELSIHYNTLKYRLKRISEMTGFDIQNSEKRLDFALSLKLYQMKNL
jgi:purine catabolism regulator